jgi:adenylylsulfate kinase-like enzyme
LAKLLADQGMTVIVAALYSNPELLAWNRQGLPNYFEIYMEASVETLRGRDTKGLYDGRTKQVVGVDIPWIPPQSPDLVINSDILEDTNAWAQRVVTKVPQLPWTTGAK